MSLSALIRANMHGLVDEWACHARDHIGAAQALAITELEDSARELFSAMADDMDTEQTQEDRIKKAHGDLPGKCEGITRYAQEHADHRVSQGFSLLDVFSEYRAARASVSRLWSGDGTADGVHPAEIGRFHEAIDEATQVSIASFDAQLNRSRDLFLGVLGHDMRSPLGAIMLLSKLLLKDDALSPNSTKSAARIYSSGSRITRMLDDLLDFTRTRLGKSLPVTLREGNMGETMLHVVEELRAYHPSSTITFETSGDLYGRWDFARLAQVVSNLGGNAIQHGDKASPITIGLEGMDGRVVLTVHNEGTPIAPQMLSRIFDPMTRGLEAGPNEKGSVGLGLYICRQIALAHGGTIGVNSDEKGTTFIVCIPRRAEERA